MTNEIKQNKNGNAPEGALINEDLENLVYKTLKTVGNTYGMKLVKGDMYDLGDTLEKAVTESLPKIDPSLRGLFCDIVMALGSDDVGKRCSDLPQATIAAREIAKIYSSLDSFDKQKNFLEEAREYAFSRTSGCRERAEIRKTFAEFVKYSGKTK